MMKKLLTLLAIAILSVSLLAACTAKKKAPVASTEDVVTEELPASYEEVVEEEVPASAEEVAE